jgi:hypothetical protein
MFSTDHTVLLDVAACVCYNSLIFNLMGESREEVNSAYSTGFLHCFFYESSKTVFLTTKEIHKWERK